MSYEHFKEDVSGYEIWKRTPETELLFRQIFSFSISYFISPFRLEKWQMVAASGFVDENKKVEDKYRISS